MEPLDDIVRRLTSELQRAQSALTTMLETIPVGIGIAEDRDCRHIRINRVAAEQLGIPLTANASMTAPPDDMPPFKVLLDGKEVAGDELPMQRAAQSGQVVGPFELEIVRADGKRVILYEHAAPLFDEQGAIRGAVGVFVDITERRRVENEQRFLATASELLASRLEYDETLSALAQLAVPELGDYCAVDVLRDDGSFGRVELVVEDASRRELAEALKKYPPVLHVDSPAAHVLRSGQPMLASECPPPIVDRSAQSPEHRALLEQFGVSTFMMAPLITRGRTLGLLTVGRFDPGRSYEPRDLRFLVDVARHAALALDNARLYRDAQEANRLKEDFLATLSHELRTPLNALLGWTHLLKMRRADEALRVRAIESIERNAQAQAHLINDLLDVSRIISGKIVLDPQHVDLVAVVNAAVEAVRPGVRMRDIDLSVSAEPIDGVILGDAARLQQVVLNLLSNAMKFTPGRGRIHVSVEQAGGAVQVSVADTGEGIDPAFLPRIFERFSQADNTSTRAHGGLGLGLAIVRTIVELHGGAVWAESEGRGKGSRFIVMLPTRTPIEQPASRDSTRQDDEER